VIHIAGPDHDDDRIEAGVPGKDALENDIELGRSDPGVSDVADVGPASAQGMDAIRGVEQLFEHPRPGLGLIQREALDRAPTHRENAIESVLASGHSTPALPIGIDVEPCSPLELRKCFGVRANLDPRPRWPDVIPGSSANRPAA